MSNMTEMKQQIDALCRAMKLELTEQNSELLDYAETQLQALQALIEDAKAKITHDETLDALATIPNKLPVEVVRMVTLSGFLSSKDLCRFLLQTDKFIKNEFTSEFVWKMILRSHYKGLKMFHAESFIRSMVDVKGYEWVFRQLVRDAEYAPAEALPVWNAPLVTLSSTNLKIFVSLRDSFNGADIFSTELTESEVAELDTATGCATIRFPRAVADVIKNTENPTVYAQVHCFRSDTNQSCCILSDRARPEDSEHFEVNAGQPPLWKRINFGDPNEQGALKMTMEGRVLLTRWYCDGRTDIDRFEDIIDEGAGLVNGAHIYFGDEEPTMCVNADVYAGGAFNTCFDDSDPDRVSVFAAMDQLRGWA
ncbi:expressed unknown protein [Seminavis robusta]|uniref:Uncharacterized protein n=1 Tax=Seminavis robusta TaxID=568900 RepID=A0A9N8D914_9STRA|nr:expressed unknown protein [Seminavis robusta]|eukprot:Sro19_g013700.1 n/a (366) ;mRNA; f:162005-163102